MSNYFNLIPNFDYVSRLPDAKISDYIQVKNLFKRVLLREDIYSNLMYFTKYDIQGDDRPDNVAHRIYSDCFRISIALKVISPKLPIGVDTTYKPYLNLLIFVSLCGIIKI